MLTYRHQPRYCLKSPKTGSLTVRKKQQQKGILLDEPFPPELHVAGDEKCEHQGGGEGRDMGQDDQRLTEGQPETRLGSGQMRTRAVVVLLLGLSVSIGHIGVIGTKCEPVAVWAGRGTRTSL